MAKIILETIRLYQTIISPFLGRHCRFEPSCSQYCYLAVKKYGAWKGAWQGVRRITRCHPWNEGGVDEP